MFAIRTNFKTISSTETWFGQICSTFTGNSVPWNVRMFYRFLTNNVNRVSKSLNQVIKFWWLWRLCGAAKLINSIDLQDVSTIKTISSTELWPPIYVCNSYKFVCNSYKFVPLSAKHLLVCNAHRFTFAVSGSLGYHL